MVCFIDGGPALSAAAAKLFLKDMTKYSLSPGDKPCIATFVPSKKVCLGLQYIAQVDCFFSEATRSWPAGCIVAKRSEAAALRAPSLLSFRPRHVYVHDYLFCYFVVAL
jgi:hypothetical protein